MDFSKFESSDWLVIAGGFVVLISGFLDWFDDGVNAFDFTFTGLIPWLLLVGAGTITFLLAGGILRPSAMPWPLIVLGSTALGALLIVIRLLIGADASDVVSLPAGVNDFGLDRAGGLWISTIGAVAAAGGGVLGYQGSGGNMRDLTDIQKMRDAFKR